MACASESAEYLFTCPVCMEIMNEAKQLQCGHSMCSSCLDKIIAGSRRIFTILFLLCTSTSLSYVGSDVECPKCRQHSQVPHNGFPTNFSLSDIIRHHLTEEDKRRHNCMMCDQMSALDDIIMCHSCNDICLCLRCAFLSHAHDGHVREELHNHMDTQVKLLKQWKDDQLPVLKSLTLLPVTVFDRCKALIDQQQSQQLKIGRKRKAFEDELCRLIDSSENELNPSNGYKFELAAFEHQLQTIQDEHKRCKTKSQQLTDALPKMLQSGDFSGVGHSGILVSDGVSIEFYCPGTNTTQMVAIELDSHCVMGVLEDGRVMMVGAPAQIIDLVTNQVVQGPSMSTERYNASSAMIGGEMYVCGGEDKKRNTLSSCEVYRNGQWMPIADMTLARELHSVVALNGLLYSIGGYSPTAQYLDSMECYSPDTYSWQPVTSPNDQRHLLSAAALNGLIFAAGGGSCAHNTSKDKVCERYNPDQNQWERVADMNKGRSSFSLVAFREKLYALGGDKDNSVESYDAVKNEWKMENITLKTRFAKVAVVVNYNT